MTTRDNGHAPESIDKTLGSSGGQVKSKRTNPFRWTLGLLLRLCIWYALLTPFFRCPSRLSDLNDTSPRVCKPYLVARSYIEPHVLPYYDTYAAPYIDVARPYLNIVDEKVYTPSVTVAKLGYDKYGAPALHQVQIYGKQQWAAQVSPHLQTVKDKVNAVYTSEVAPQIQRVDALLSPYYGRASSAIRSTCQDYILPFYARSMPFIGKTYTSGQDILTTTVLPYAQSTWSSAIFFANSSLWPKIAGLYSENVEPQLVKIGQRLASYREGKQYQKVTDETDSSSAQHTPLTSSSRPVKAEPSTTTTITQAPATPKKLSPAEIEAQTREKITSDLQAWKEKFAAAVDNAVEELESRIGEMVNSYATGEAKHNGDIIVTALQAVVEQETTSVKNHINALAQKLPIEDLPQEEEEAQEDLVKHVRESAITIRDQAHALREWRNSFDEELLRRVSAAVHATLSVLDSVRDLGFQEIGQRWAWMDGVTYNDWENYHSLKAEFEGWRNQFLEARMKHPKLEEARSMAEDILGEGMGAAEAAAKELARLKEVGKWKISAREVSDNFETRTEPPPALPQPEKVSDEEPEISVENEEPQINMEGSDQDIEFSGAESEDSTIGLDHTEDNTSTEDEEPQSQGTEHVERPTDDEDEVLLQPAERDEGYEKSQKSAWGAEAAEIVSDQTVAEAENSSETVNFAIKNQAQDTIANINNMAQSPDAETVNKAAEALSDQVPNYGTVEDLVKKLLADKDAAFAEDIRAKLQAIYGAADLNSASSSEVSEQHTVTSAIASATEVVETVMEKLDEPAESVPSSGTPSPSAKPDVEDSADSVLGSDEVILDDVDNIPRVEVL
ncbi:hypothetical protein FE257_011816 [Aspergillus nanangensis]|uniref:Transcription factor hoxa13 n=1 Tax=Aspergillus nanangensis TaxID=2582783 RepID=A0AAD4GX24_ASPNN|nr:hypothetical protein FE257_011816 [Aspergillus nanangensis]